MSPEIFNKSILDDYSIFRNDREFRGGGVMIGFKNHFEVNKLFELIIGVNQAISIILNTHNRKIIIVCLYMPPISSDKLDFCTKIFNELKKQKVFGKSYSYNR